MSESVATWLKDFLPRTPGAVRAVAKRELINAAREFFRESAVWLHIDEDIDFVAGTYTYTATPPDANSEIVQIYSVERNGLPLQFKVERPLGERETGTPLYWTADKANFTLWPTPVEDDTTVIVRSILIPTASTSVLPDMAASKYYEGILDGALARMYGHPAKPYSNPQYATYHLNRFRNAIGVAAGERKTGGISGPNWQFPSFGK